MATAKCGPSRPGGGSAAPASIPRRPPRPAAHRDKCPAWACCPHQCSSSQVPRGRFLQDVTNAMPTRVLGEGPCGTREAKPRDGAPRRQTKPEPDIKPELHLGHGPEAPPSHREAEETAQLVQAALVARGRGLAGWKGHMGCLLGAAGRGGRGCRWSTRFPMGGPSSRTRGRPCMPSSRSEGTGPLRPRAWGQGLGAGPGGSVSQPSL